MISFLEKVTTYLYDANGNLTAQQLNGANTTYTWDDENRLTYAAYPDGTIEQHTYSADGLRQSKTNATGTTHYVWDGNNLLQEADATLATIAQYTDYPGYWGGLTSLRRGILSRFFGFDFLSNARFLTSSTGVVTDEYTYAGYGPSGEHYGGETATGTVMRAGGQVAPPVTVTHYGGQWTDPDTLSGVPNPYQYGGEVGYHQDTPTRFQVRERELDPTTGRWLSRDPIGFAGGNVNLYGYVGNDPVNLTDAAGLRDTLDVRPGDPGWNNFTIEQRKALYQRAQHPDPNETWGDIIGWSLGQTGKVWQGYGVFIAGAAQSMGKMAIRGAIPGLAVVSSAQEMQQVYNYFKKYGVSKNSAYVFLLTPLMSLADKGNRAWHGDAEAFGEIWAFGLSVAPDIQASGASLLAGSRGLSGNAITAFKNLQTRGLIRPADGVEGELGLFKGRTNRGEYAGVPIRMSKKAVRQYAERAGVGLKGIKVTIKFEHMGRDLYGYAHPNMREIWLYPDAFMSEEALVRTLGHERTHIYQFRTFGHPADPELGSEMGKLQERGALDSEDAYWVFFKTGGKG